MNWPKWPRLTPGAILVNYGNRSMLPQQFIVPAGMQCNPWTCESVAGMSTGNCLWKREFSPLSLSLIFHIPFSTHPLVYTQNKAENQYTLWIKDSGMDRYQLATFRNDSMAWEFACIMHGVSLGQVITATTHERIFARVGRWKLQVTSKFSLPHCQLHFPHSFRVFSFELQTSASITCTSAIVNWSITALNILRSLTSPFHIHLAQAAKNFPHVR